MKVRAKHWVNYGGTYYAKGETFEVPTTEVDDLKDVVEIAEEPVKRRKKD